MKTYEIYFPSIMMVLIFTVIISLLLWPFISQPLIWLVVIAGAGVSAVLAINRHYRKYAQEHHNRLKFVRNACLDILGILLAIGGAIWLAGIVAAQVVPAASRTFESLQPGTGNTAGIIVGLIAALGVGLGVGSLIQWIWRKLMARLE
jgi:hypothetical protein